MTKELNLYVTFDDVYDNVEGQMRLLSPSRYKPSFIYNGLKKEEGYSKILLLVGSFVTGLSMIL